MTDPAPVDGEPNAVPAAPVPPVGAPEAPPAKLWDRMRDDPQYAPEHLALEPAGRPRVGGVGFRVT